MPEETDDEYLEMPSSASAEEASYTTRFLTFVHGILFRIAALRQELAEIYGYEGRFDEPFRERMRHMAPAERESFLVAAREMGRLEAMQSRFEIVETQFEDRDEQVQGFLMEHEAALEAWYEAQPLFGTDPDDISPISPVGGVGRSAKTPADDGLHRSLTEAAHPRDSLFRAHGAGMGSVRAAIQSAGGELGEIAGDDFTDHVLTALADSELHDAERRFGLRLRWLASLPPRQRMAVTLRAAGLKRRDVASRMGISEESVKTHLQRADEEWNRWRGGNAGREPG